jgi:hypothetical protein
MRRHRARHASIARADGGRVTAGDGTRAAARTDRGGVDLAVALAFSIALNLVYFDRRVVGVNDTFYNFADFHIFYSELLFHGGLASWWPYGTYGLQADYEQIASLGPLSYLIGALGALLRVRDALLLFKLAVVGEQLVFVFGVWRLARGLFPTRATVQLLSIAAAGTSVWYAQQWWDLRIYVLLPLVLSFLFEFIETRRADRFWLAGATGVAWCLGGLPYWIPVWILMLAVIGGVAVRDWPATLRALGSRAPRDLAALALFAIAVAGYAWFVLHALDGAVLRAIDRDPVTGKVGPENFRTYGGNANLVIVANALLFGWPVHLPWGSGADNSVYLGLVPVVGLAVAVVRERSRTFVALVAGAAVLVWLSLGGVFTEAAYHLPGFAYYRHVGLTFGLVKVLLLVASGYGLERVWASRVPRVPAPALWIAVGILAVEGLAAAPRLLGPAPWSWIGEWGVHVLVRLGVYAAALAAAAAAGRCRRPAIALALALDLALYQLAVWETRVPRVHEPALLAATAAREPVYQEARHDAPRDPESARAIDLAQHTGSRELYWYVYQFANFDPCRGQFRTDYYQAGVDRLLGFERANGRQDALLGCEVPKLRVVADADFARSADEARERLRDAVRAGETRPTVIEAAGGPRAGARSGAPAGTTTVERFTLSELVAQVDVQAPDGAWLVYDDAWHAGWRASLNGVEAPVAVANLAWKAVRVPAGRSTVRLWFRHGANHWLGPAIALYGLAAGVALVAWMLHSIARPTPRPSDPA